MAVNKNFDFTMSSGSNELNSRLVVRPGRGRFRSSCLPSLQELSQQAVERALCRLLTKHQAHENLNVSEGKAEGFCLVDATAGNGHDSLFLLRALQSVMAGPEFCVRAFDIQAAALESARARIEQAEIEAGSSARFLGGTADGVANSNIAGGLPGDFSSGPLGGGLLPRWQGHLLDHREFASGLDRVLPFAKVGIAMFNLGFLPGSDKTVITRAGSTLVALQSLCERLCPGGLLSVHCYAGHPGGAEETQAVLDFCRALDDKHWKSFMQEFINKQRNRELLILVERLF